MPRTRPRKLLAACAGYIVSLTSLIDGAVLRRCQKHLFSIRRWGMILKYRIEYDGSPDDIFIVTYPKSGTTWLQMILYQLTTDGSMDFTHIYEISPYLDEIMIPEGRKISDLRGTPRLLKTHLAYNEIPRGPGRYIYCVRNGLDVAVSSHHQIRNLVPAFRECSAGEFFTRFLEGRVPFGNWFEHVAGWLRNEDRLNVLVVSYEELSADLEAAVKRIADFCGITIDPAAMPRILERCSFAFMREHKAKFSITLPEPADSGLVRQGQVGGWREELDARAASDFQEACDRRLRDLGEDMVRVLSGRGTPEGEPAL